MSLNSKKSLDSIPAVVFPIKNKFLPFGESNLRRSTPNESRLDGKRNENENPYHCLLFSGTESEMEEEIFFYNNILIWSRGNNFAFVSFLQIHSTDFIILIRLLIAN